MTRSRRDIALPASSVETAAGHDLRRLEGDDLIRQRLIRFLFTRPGEMPHRPDWGLALQDFRNKPPMPETYRRLRNRIDAGMTSLAWVDTYGLELSYDDAGAFVIDLVVVIDGREIRIPEVTIG